MCFYTFDIDVLYNLVYYGKVFRLIDIFFSGGKYTGIK